MLTIRMCKSMMSMFHMNDQFGGVLNLDLAGGTKDKIQINNVYNLQETWQIVRCL